MNAVSLAIYIEVCQVNAEIEAMKARNKIDGMNKLVLTYDERFFNQKGDQLGRLHQKLIEAWQGGRAT